MLSPRPRRSCRSWVSARDRGHRHPRPGQAVRPPACRRRHRPRRPRGRRLRLPRGQRLRQDDDRAHAAGPGAPAQRGDRAARRADAAGGPPGAAARRRPDRGAGPLRPPVRAGEPGVARRLRPGRVVAHPASPHRRGAGAGGPGGRRPPPGEGVLPGDAAAARGGRRPAAAAGAAGARRADERARPAGHRRGACAAAGPQPQRDDGLPVQPPARRGGAAVLPGRRPRPRPAGTAGPTRHAHRAHRGHRAPHPGSRSGARDPRRAGHLDRGGPGGGPRRRPGRGQRPAGARRGAGPRLGARGAGPGAGRACRRRRRRRAGGGPTVIVVELRKLFRRPRTWATIAVLNALPLAVAVLLVLTDLAPRPGQGPAFLSAVLTNGALFPLAAPAIVLPLFLPIAVAVVAGDAIAGEAQAGTLRYLLARPAGRTRLLVAKLVSVVAFVLVTVLVVAVVGYVLGHTLFDAQPVAGTSVSGTSLTVQQLLGRTFLSIGYVTVSMCGVAAFALFFSTLTDSPLGATLGALAVLVASSLLFTLNAASPIAPYLPTRYWLSFVDFFRDPILWRDIVRGLALQGVYVGVLLAAAWANFTTKDVTS